MGTITKCFIVLITLSTQIFNAQFNTLTYSKKTEEKPKIDFSNNQNINTADKKVEGEKKKTWKRIFGGTSKSDLKKEIDSLKTLIIQSNKIKNKENKIDFKKVEDSLLNIVKDKIQNTTVQRSNPYKKIDFVKEETVSDKTKISMPIDNKLVVTSPFSIRTHPIFGFKRMHNGVDLKANYEQIRSVLGGIVTATGWDPKGGGNFMKISHSGRFETSYLHLSEIYYKAGEYVNAGFIIGKSGNTGNSTGPHLHFAVKEFGRYINPIQFLNDLIKVNNLISTYYDNEHFANR
ncbi:TPA: M23 family metallopeptidase [Elizabethkingia anophelis]